ncbi:sensor histidine kinase [Sphaerotilus sp.]|uniref:sensor histidine kinase n=1 Tax=Sphaerotilus sp. TaxID=2093942 RepID=UPI0025E6E1BB|nr:HAMP domain-containing sensor histidine kinase [Sphaerotilus sp.]
MTARWRGGGAHSLYLSIYLTVVAALLVFALVAVLLVNRHTEAESGRIEVAVSDRTLALVALLQNSLPPASAAPEVQREALLDWSRRLRVPMALDAADGQRLAVSPFYSRKVGEDRRDEEHAAARTVLADGRALWVLRSRGPHGDDRLPALGRLPHDRDRDRHGPPSQGLNGLLGHWIDEASGLLVLLGVLFAAVTIGCYPVVRRLTRRLEALERGVEQFGAGDLGHRVAVVGQDEVAAVATSFNRAAQRIEDLVRANRALLANASHELRSPLARLKMALEMMEHTPAERRDALRQEIACDIRELDGLVEEVLLASRLDAQGQGERRTESVDLLGLLVEEAARVGASAEGEPVVVEAEERLLRRALRNLLENARRYGGDEVDATVHRVGTGQVEVQICDRGPGVPESYREQVFEPFFRLPGHAERAGGVGLGLSLVRQIAQRHGGSVRCLAREGGGSCFVLTLPRGAVVAHPGAPGLHSG